MYLVKSEGISYTARQVNKIKFQILFFGLRLPDYSIKYMEDEYHFLFECSKNLTLRQKFFESIKSNDSNLDDKTTA